MEYNTYRKNSDDLLSIFNFYQVKLPEYVSIISFEILKYDYLKCSEFFHF